MARNLLLMAIPDRNKCCINRIVYNSIVHIPPDVNPVENMYMWAEVNPAPDGELPFGGDWYVTSIDIAGVNYPMTTGSSPGGAASLIQFNSCILNEYSVLNNDCSGAPIILPSLHCSMYEFNNVCCFGAIAPQGTVITFNWTWTDNIGITINDSTTLTNEVVYTATTHSTTIDVSAIVVPTPPLTDASVSLDAGNIFKREAGFILSGGTYQPIFCTFMDQQSYWDHLENYARCQYGSQVSMTHYSGDVSNIQISISGVPQGLMDVSDAGYICNVNENCGPTDGSVPYVWS